MKENYKIEVSARTIVFTVFFLILLNFLWIMRDLIISLFIAFIIMSALRPPVSFLEKYKIPRFIAAIFVYFLFLASFFYVFFLILPSLISESILLLRAFPDVIQRLAPQINTYVNFESLFQFAPNIANQLFDIVKGIFSNAIFVITTLFFGFYFTLDENVMRKLLTRFFEVERAQQAISIFDKAERRLNAWFWGEIFLMTIVGLMTFIGLNIIGMRYTLALAVLAGLLEIVPTIGPILSAVPAVLIGFSQSYVMGFASVALYFIVQQLENNLVVPIVMRKAVGLNPIITLMGLIIGSRIGGVLGALIAIPATVFIETALLEIIKKLAENPR